MSGDSNMEGLAHFEIFSALIWEIVVREAVF